MTGTYKKSGKAGAIDGVRNYYAEILTRSEQSKAKGRGQCDSGR